MKKIKAVFLILAAVLLIAAAGCGSRPENRPESAEAESAASSAVSEVSFELVDEEQLEESAEEVDEKQQEEAAEESGEDRAEASQEEGGGDLPEGPAEESAADQQEEEETDGDQPAETGLLESDTPFEKDEVAAYIHTFGHLPDNFITKSEAKALGWVSKEGNLWDVAPGCAIGGDYFSNYEGNLPEAPGRDYYECDVNYEGGYRQEERIVFSNDGLIYYTGDHYETFELLYGEEE